MRVTSTTSTTSSVWFRALASQTSATPEEGAIRETLSGWTTRLRLRSMTNTKPADQPSQRTTEGTPDSSASPDPTRLSIVGRGADVQQNERLETMES